MEHKCINCGENAPLNWFCLECTKIKEESYSKSKELGIKNYWEIIIERDKVLHEYKTKQYKPINNGKKTNQKRRTSSATIGSSTCKTSKN